jgi:hypothetical protein
MMRDAFTEVDRARSALWSLDSGTDRDRWVKTGMAAKAAGLDFDDFHDWSARAGNYKGEAECRSVWQSIKDGGIGAASLFGAARAAGWTDGEEAPANRPQSHQDKRRPAEASKPPLHDPRIIWDACEPPPIDQEYIERKIGLPDSLRVYAGGLTIAGNACDGSLVQPVFTLAGDLVSLQFITPQGKKLFLPGCTLPPDACLIVGGPIKPDGVAYLVEGIGQAWSAHQATRAPAVVAFGAGRMAGVAQALRQKYQAARLVVVPDVGKEDQAAAIAKDVQGAWVELAPELGKNGDINDLHQSQGMEAVAELLEHLKRPPSRFNLAERTANRLFIGEPPPVNWLVRGIFPLGVCCLVASPPNVGKSFLSLDMAAKVAGRSGQLYAFGAAVAAHGRAVYVSAEDDEPEIHRRLWSLCGGVMPERLHVLSLPDVGHFGIIECDRQSREYKPTETWRDLVAEIGELPDVKLILLDTLQALTTGDTNTVEATQPLMNEATALAATTGACVVLIHHVAKRSTQEIKTALDAMEAIRGSGAIAGTARAAYVLWPPSDGGKAVCEVLGEPYQEGKIALGIVAKKYGDARKDRSVFVRDKAGILQDRTEQYNALSGADDSDILQAQLLQAICEQWADGQAFTASNGTNGLHARRHELAECFHAQTRAWFEEMAGKLLVEGNIKRFTYRGGARYVPADATEAVPKDALAANAESIVPEGGHDARVAA